MTCIALVPDVDDVVLEPEELVPLSCFARETKASKVLEPDSTAFAAKTIPWPQWPT